MLHRTLIISCFMLILFSNHSFAQFQFGPQIGMNFATVTLSDEFDEGLKEYRTTKVGVNTGLHLSAGSDHFAYQPGFLYSQKGLKIKDEFGATHAYRFNYFKSPHMFLGKFFVGSENISIRIGGGPYVGVMVAASQRTKTADGDVNKTVADDFENWVRLDMGLKFETGVEVKLGPGDLVISPSYNLGLLPVDAIDDDQLYTERTYSDRWRNSVISVSATYLFTPSAVGE